MAYQNVGTPRFYVDYLLWLKSHGILEYASQGVDYVTGSALEMVSLNPSNQYRLFSSGAGSTQGFYSYTTYSQAPQILDSNGAIKNYVAVLGHNAASANASIHFANATNSSGVIGDSLVNYTDGIPEHDGFTIATNIDFGAGDVRIHSLGSTAATDHYIGCYSHGNYYTMPHSPDLNLTLTREYGGIKTIETKGGASLSNAFYTKPPAWGNLGAWQLGDEDFSTGGRKIWSLSFSFLSDSSVFPDNPTEIADAGGWEVDDTTPDFMSEVVKKTNGGQLPFIFQPDKDNNSEFAICKFDQSSFSFQQTAPILYSVKMKIREVW